MKTICVTLALIAACGWTASAAIVLPPGEYRLTGAVQPLEGDRTGVTFPEGTATKYSSITAIGTDQTVVIHPSPTNNDFFLSFTSVALDINGPGPATGLSVAAFRYVEIHYTLSDAFVGSTHQLFLNSTGSVGSFDAFVDAANIPSTAGSHSIVIDLLSDDGTTLENTWTGEWTTLRWDFWNNGGNQGKSFTLDKIVYAPSVNRTVNRPTVLALDGGGARVSNGGVTHDGSLGGIGGISTQGVTTAKHSYVGQLYDFAGLQLAASPQTVDEGGTRQLSAALAMDDDTTLAAAGGFAWSVTDGPMTIDGNGLASGQPVFQDTLATAQASSGGLVGTLDLTVLDTLKDNFGSYAGDGIDDDWQFQFFGLDNPLAGPTQNPDFDGQNNLFEFLAKVDPTDPASFFEVTAKAVPGQPAQKEIVFQPRYPERSYTVQTSTLLTEPSWSTLTGASVSDSGTERTVTDPNAAGPRKFYRVQISR